MLNISHIKNRVIQIILLVFLGVSSACYMPRGAFLANEKTDCFVQNDSIKMTLPVEFQVYNYFRIKYVKNDEIYIAHKVNDSTIVFLLKELPLIGENRQFRVEAGIVPFLEKNKLIPLKFP